MEFMPHVGTDEINKLIRCWNGQYYNVEETAGDYIVLNCDEAEPEKIPQGTVISCGMSPKATITASSIKEDGFVCCIQRAFCDSMGQIIEQSEFFVPTYGYDLTVSLSAAAANLIIGGIFNEPLAYDL